MAYNRRIGTFVGLFALLGGCQIVGSIEPDLVLASGDEICGDGVDDDGDGLADCEDPDCGTSLCVPNAPPGWEGPFWVRRSAWDGTSGPSCPAGFSGSAHYMSPAPATCTPCACGDVQDGACAPPKFRCWASKNCSGDAVNTTLQNVGQCDAPFGPFPLASASCRIIGPGAVQSEGACVASGGELTEPQLFQQIVSACELAATTGCAEGSTCAPPLEPGARICVRSSGGGVCPSGWDGETLTAYAGGQDARTCSACTCTLEGAGCEGGAYRAFDTNSCTASGSGADAAPPINITDETCVDVSTLADSGTFSILAFEASAYTGSCTSPQGGAPSGAVLLEGAIKYCCR
ncbi:hypothetical protein [Polyangium sp. y55x31]|uniref:hypothetical protein n=1 Tax=Polyangium sp. y55x31 TaxID=3042688 RepID=UPI0024824AC4|nr:hypothetical protein [Polyangium sp. y55x31]MDI1476128.1 hypothetical protein [Polyangium sp. y55x31]